MRIDAGWKQKQSMYNVYLYDDHFNMQSMCLGPHDGVPSSRRLRR